MPIFGFPPPGRAAFLAVAIWGCKEDRPRESPKPTPVAPQKADFGTSPAMPVTEKLAYEAQHRPPGVVTADQVYAAIEKAGVALTDKQQHVAAPFLAQYCFGAKGPGGMAFSVCEYQSDDAAVAGKKESETALASVPGRTLVQKGKTVLTVREPDPATPESGELKKKAIDTFNAL